MITPGRVREALGQTESVLEEMAYDLAKAYLDQAEKLAAIEKVCKQFPGMATGKIRKILEGRNG